MSKTESVADYEDLMGDGLLLKKILKISNKDRLYPSQIVTIKYSCFLPGMIPLETNVQQKFILGDKEVIEALDIAVAKMTLHEKAEIIADPKYAYGVFGRPPSIPANTKLTFFVELLKSERPPNMYLLTLSERLEYGASKNARGNELLQRNEYDAAAFVFRTAADILSPGADGQGCEELSKLRIKCLNSQALKGDWKAVIAPCMAALRIESNAEASYRLSLAHKEMGNLQKAIEYMELTIKLQPNCNQFKKELLEIKKSKVQHDYKNPTPYTYTDQTDILDVTVQEPTKPNVVLAAPENNLLQTDDGVIPFLIEKERRKLIIDNSKPTNIVSLLKKYKLPACAVLGITAVAGLAYAYYKSA